MRDMQADCKQGDIVQTDAGLAATMQCESVSALGALASVNSSTKTSDGFKHISRREFVAAAGVAGAAALSGTSLLAFGGCTPSTGASFATDTYLIAGQIYDNSVTPIDGRPFANGIKVLAFNTSTGDLALAADASSQICASAFVADAEADRLYVCDAHRNNVSFGGNGGGGNIFSYNVSSTGRLDELDSSLSFGSEPSAMAADVSGTWLLTTHVGDSGLATLVKPEANGQLTVSYAFTETSLVARGLNRDGGAGAVTDRYLLNKDGAASAPTDIVYSAIADFFLVCDREANLLHSFALDVETGAISPACEPFWQPDGTRGSRCALHPEMPWCYVAGADSPQLLVLHYDGSGTLTQLQNISPLERPEMFDERPEGFEYTQDFICASADGRFVFCGARVANGTASVYELITVFAVNQENGTLAPVQYYFLENAHGAIEAALSPDGSWLAVACRWSAEIMMLSVSETGTLSLHHRFSIASPVSLCWYKAD